MPVVDPIETFEFDEVGGDENIVTPYNTDFPSLTYYGFSVHEDASTPAVASFHLEERDSDGTFIRTLDFVELAANGSARESYDPGVMLTAGNAIYLNHVAGEYTGTIRCTGKPSGYGIIYAQDGAPLLTQPGGLLLKQ